MTTRRTLSVERATSTAHRLEHYEGVCGNIHGHNMEWDVEADVTMAHTGEDNMPVDLKEISEVIDEVDHAVLLNRDDRLLRFILEQDDHYDHEMVDAVDGDSPFLTRYENLEPLGDVFVFDGDPTCEVMSQWMANQICRLDGVVSAEVTVHETEKYGISTEGQA